jgi:hypothetical protein
MEDDTNTAYMTMIAAHRRSVEALYLLGQAKSRSEYDVLQHQRILRDREYRKAFQAYIIISRKIAATAGK